jgi:hypothetical protein
VALLARGLPYKLGLILAAVAGVAAGLLAEVWTAQTPKPAAQGNTP